MKQYPQEIGEEASEGSRRLLSRLGDGNTSTSREDFDRLSRIYEVILSTTDDFAYVFDPEGRFLYANTRLLKVWAKTLDQVVGKTCHELGYPTWHADMHMREIKEIVRTKLQIRGEVPFTSGSGIFGVYDYIFQPVLDANGEVEVIVGTTRDVTDRKRSEEALRQTQVELSQRAEELEGALKSKVESEYRYRFLADTVPQIVWTATADGVLHYFNQRWFDYAGTNAEEMKQTGWTIFIHPDDLPRVVVVWKHSVDTGADYEIEFRIKRASDGVYRWHLVRAFPMKDPEGNVMQWVGTCTDIHDQRQLGERFAETAAKFRSLFEQSSALAGIMTPEGVLLETNRISLESYGYTAEETIGVPFWEGGWWRRSKDIQQKIMDGTRLAASGVAYRETLPIHLADGTERIVDLALHPIRNEDGKVIFINPAGVDVTERHRTHANAEFLAQLTQKLSIVSDAEEINRIATREIGTFLKTDRCYCFQVMPDYDHIRVLPDWHAVSETGLAGSYSISSFGTQELSAALRKGPISVEDVHTHPWTKGYVENYESLRLISYAFVPFVQEGKWVASLGVVCDRPRHWTEDESALLENAAARVWPLIERARIEGALRESEERFRAMSDNIAPLAWMASADGRPFWFNKRWYEHTGHKVDQPCGDGWWASFHPDDVAQARDSWTTSVRDGFPWDQTFRLRNAKGEDRWFLSRAIPISDDKGNISLWFGTASDVTELRNTEQALQVANEQLGDRATHLENIVRQRTQRLSETIAELEAFSYSISHDMRSPLRSMISFSDILCEDYSEVLDAAGIDYLTRISNAGRRMDQLIQDVLSFSRIGAKEIALEPVDADVLIRDVIQSYPNLHSDRVTISIASQIPSIIGNEALLTQCISNLLENAVKFVAPGTRPVVKIWAEQRGNRTQIHVKDNGIGIPEHSLERIFEIFHRVGRDGNGTGIGLAIVRKAAEKMGGKVGVSSVQGEGSLFWLDLKSVS